MGKGKWTLYYQKLTEIGLQELQNKMSQALGLALRITYPDGRRLTRGSNPCSFCSLVNTSPEARARCAASRVTSARTAVAEGKEIVHTCHVGLVHLAVPLEVAGEIIAVVLGGNVALRPLDAQAVSAAGPGNGP